MQDLRIWDRRQKPSDVGRSTSQAEFCPVDRIAALTNGFKLVFEALEKRCISGAIIHYDEGRSGQAPLHALFRDFICFSGRFH